MTRLAVILLFVAGLILPAAASFGALDDRQPDTSEWKFRVYLDDNEIGYHNFRLMDSGNERRLTAEANFKVKFLFFTAYRYEHVNSEIWRGDCLQRIEARTDANGKQYSVVGSRGPDGFEVQSSELNDELSGCIKTFAYWDPDFLQEDALLNAQTGEYSPVRVEPAGEDTLRVRGQDVDAQRYRLEAEGVNVELWYSEDRRWLGLKSTLKNGRQLRYELL